MAKRYKGDERREVFKAAIKNATSKSDPIQIQIKEGSPKRKPKVQRRKPTKADVTSKQKGA